MRRDELERRLPAPLDAQGQRGDRAVGDVVGAARRVGVDPADGLPAGGADGDRARARRRGRRARSPPARAPRCTCVARAEASPPRRRRSPSSESTPLATHGVVRPATLTRPSATSSHAPGRRRTPCRAARSSARRARGPSCGRPSPRQPCDLDVPAGGLDPAARTSRPGTGLSSFVRGSGARYIHSRGRWRSGASAPAIWSSQAARRSCPLACPCAAVSPSVASPIAIQPSSGARGSGRVSLTAAAGPGWLTSNRVHQSEPTGCSPGPLVDRVADPGAARASPGRRRAGRRTRSDRRRRGPRGSGPRSSAPVLVPHPATERIRREQRGGDRVRARPGALVVDLQDASGPGVDASMVRSAPASPSTASVPRDGRQRRLRHRDGVGERREDRRLARGQDLHDRPPAAALPARPRARRSSPRRPSASPSRHRARRGGVGVARPRRAGGTARGSRGTARGSSS